MQIKYEQTTSVQNSQSLTGDRNGLIGAARHSAHDSSQRRLFLTAGTGPLLLTDPAGHCGMLSVRQIPVGHVCAQLLDEGIAPRPFDLGLVTAGATTGPGIIRLKRTEEVYGWFEDTLTWDDGRPLRGAASMEIDSGYGESAIPLNFTPQHLDRHGRFRG